MSFILDALRKSENSRLRQDHPAIFSTPLARSRARLPRWVPVVATLLIINLLFIGYALWRDRPPADNLSDPAAAPAARVIAASEPAPSAATSAASQRVVLPARTPISAATLPGDQTAAESAGRQAAPAVRAEPVAEAAPRVTRDDLLARGNTIPPAELNMHVYDPNAAVRFVLLNGQRLREGELSREGLRVERIMPEGVVLRFGNASFAVNLQ